MSIFNSLMDRKIITTSHLSSSNSQRRISNIRNSLIIPGTSNFCTSLFPRRSEEEEELEMKKMILLERDEDLDLILIEELQKPCSQKLRKNQTKAFEEKDEGALVYLLKQIPGFLQFLNYNGINDKTLKEGVGQFNYLKVEKGDYVFREGDTSKRFYGIIKGKISIRTKLKVMPTKTPWQKKEEMKDDVNNLNNLQNPDILKTKDIFASIFNQTTQKETLKELTKFSSEQLITSLLNKPLKKVSRKNILQPNETNNINKIGSFLSPSKRSTYCKTSLYKRLNSKLNDDEKEILVLAEGMCFGEWALLYNAPRKASALALKDTHLFYLEKTSFDMSFSKSLTNAESNRKAFLINIIPPFKTMPKHKFAEIYEKIIPQFFVKNNIVYLEGDIADSLYFVFQGECTIKIDITKPYNFIKQFNYLQKDKKDEKEEKNEKNEKIKKNIFNKNKNETNIKEHEDFKLQQKMFTKNYHNIIKLARGDISGVEVAAGLQKLNHSLIVSSEQAVILKVNVSDFAEYKNAIFTFLMQLYIEKKDIIENSVGMHQELNRKMKLGYQDNIFKNIKNQNASVSFSSNNYDAKKMNIQAIFNDDDIAQLELDDERDKKAALFLSGLSEYKFKTKYKTKLKITNMTVNENNENIMTRMNKSQSQTYFPTNIIKEMKQKVFKKIKIKISDEDGEDFWNKKVKSKYVEKDLPGGISNLKYKTISNNNSKSKSKNFISERNISKFDKNTSASSLNNKNNKNLSMNHDITAFKMISKEDGQSQDLHAHENIKEENVNENIKRNQILINKYKKNKRTVYSMSTGVFDMPLMCMIEDRNMDKGNNKDKNIDKDKDNSYKSNTKR